MDDFTDIDSFKAAFARIRAADETAKYGATKSEILGAVSASFEWLGKAEKSQLSQISEDLQRPTAKVYLDYVEETLDKRLHLEDGVFLPIDYNIYDSWRRISKYFADERGFKSFADGITVQSLADYRSEAFVKLRRAWHTRLTPDARYIISELSVKHEYKYEPDESDLVRTWDTSVAKSEYFNKELVAQLKGVLEAQSTKGNSPRQEDINSEHDKDTIISVQNTTILRLRSKVKFAERPTLESLRILADECRNARNKINYSKLGKKLGRTNKTAKKWCNDYRIE